MGLKLATHTDGIIKLALNDAGWIEDEVLAAGQLRQGKAPTMVQMITGVALVEVLRPRRSKKLPRHFVMAVTEHEVFAFKATGGSGEESSSIYTINIRENVEARYPRDSVSLADIPEGEKSKGGIMTIDGESFPVARPNLNGDPNTDELLAVLSKQPAAVA